MRNSALIEIFRSFGKEDMNRFSDFILSPFFNKRRILPQMFSYLNSLHPEFDDTAVDKEYVWKILYPGKPYNYGVMKNLIHDLTKLTESFLSFDKFMSDGKAAEKYLMKSLADRNLYKIFSGKYNIIERKYRKSELLYVDYYKDFAEIKWSQLLISYFNLKQNRIVEPADTGELIILDFIIQFSLTSNDIHIQETAFNEKKENPMIYAMQDFLYDKKTVEKFLEFLKSKSEKDYFFIGIFMKMTAALRSPGDSSLYFELKKIIYEKIRLFEEDTKRDIFSGLNNVLGNLKDASGLDKNRERFEMLVQLDNQKIFEEKNGLVMINLYTLAVKVSAFCKETSFIEHIIKKYLPKISDEFKTNMEIYSKAYLHYSKNEFQKSNEFISLIETDSFALKLNTRDLMLINSFEMNDYDSFIFIQDNFNHFLQRNKSVEENYRDNSKKFIRFADRLFKLRQMNDRRNVKNLKDEIMQSPVVNKRWLIEKADEFLRKH